MRRGATLIEMTTMIAIAVALFSSSIAGVHALQRFAAVDPSLGSRAEQACGLLRRDLARGRAEHVGDELRIAVSAEQTVVWRVADGHLLRNERLLLPVEACTVAISDGVLSLMVTPRGLPPRRIEAAR